MNAFDEEWAGLKHDAAPRTHLASAGENGGWGETSGSGGGGVKSAKNAWNTAGESVNGLRGGVRKALKELETGQKGAGAGGKVGGLESAAAQVELHATWLAYVEAVNRRCGELSDKLEKAGSHHYKNDDETEAAFQHTRTTVDVPDSADGKGGNGSPHKGR